MFLAAVAFLAILLILVLSHELGHFLFAKLKGVKVEEFAFGFPPRLFRVSRGETSYSFNLLPLGGFVRIYGEEGEESNDPRSFSSQKFSDKLLIVLAGVLFNLILGYLLISAGFLAGTPVSATDEETFSASQIRIAEVEPYSPAASAGLERGDELLTLEAGGRIIRPQKMKEVQEFIADAKGSVLQITINRAGQTLTKEARLKSITREGEGALGIQMARFGIKTLPFSGALREGFKTTYALTALSAAALFGFFSELFSGGASFEAVSGPIGIAFLIGDFSRLGLIFLIQLAALLSLNLALINLIPFPGLDGGRALLLIIEKLSPTPLPWKLTRAIHTAGFALLLLLILLVSYHDILKFTS